MTGGQQEGTFLLDVSFKPSSGFWSDSGPMHIPYVRANTNSHLVGHTRIVGAQQQQHGRHMVGLDQCWFWTHALSAASWVRVNSVCTSGLTDCHTLLLYISKEFRKCSKIVLCKYIFIQLLFISKSGPTDTILKALYTCSVSIIRFTGFIYIYVCVCVLNK